MTGSPSAVSMQPERDEKCRAVSVQDPSSAERAGVEIGGLSESNKLRRTTGKIAKLDRENAFYYLPGDEPEADLEAIFGEQKRLESSEMGKSSTIF
ncbi:hypothetical protein RUND412_003779 [Rhizina undulata]